MNLLEFQQQFPTEEACIAYLIQKRWPEGYRCVRCSHDSAWYLAKRHTYDCKACRKTYSVTADTLFHKTHGALQEWFWAIFLMSQSKKGISTLELQRLLGASDYRRVAHMQQRIRQAMQARENLYQLEGFIEVDESFFGGSFPGGKRGKGSENKTQVLVQASVGLEQQLQYAKMTVIENGKAKTLEKTLQQKTKPGSCLLSDGNPSYNQMHNRGFVHYAKTMRFPEQNDEHLPWVHILIANAKRFILGTHHSVRSENLQAYLDEFCYRLNRRGFYTGIFERLFQASLSFNPCLLRA